MRLVERYIFGTTFWAFVSALGVLTFMIWITQALREFDLLTTKGQSLVTFLAITGLGVPSLVMIIAPIALFIAVLYSLNKLNSDSELIVMSASGLSPFRLMRPFALLTIMAALVVSIMSVYVMPWSFHALRDLVTEVRSDFLTRVVRPGTFTTLDQGFVFHYRERGPNGELLGVFMQDRRDPEKVSTYLAELGQTINNEDASYLMMEKGSIQRQQPNSRDAALIGFDSYAIDLAQFGADAGSITYKPRERSTADLMRLKPDDPSVKQQYGKFRSELHDRFVNPLYALAFGLIAFAALGQARTTRQGRSSAIVTAIIVVMSVRIAGFAASNLAARSASGVLVMYAVPLVSVVVTSFIMFGPTIPLPRLPTFPLMRPRAA
ncbi:LPS export ABC transporter permease LptF [Lichenifustis flavocetrariae]|uniref:LPS export ABC transporter permease LptF n=1 Tax=Lichenifustis flavocetrariae TaxID=2949735 RepID=A0AA41YT21_9HYPH|nr:LPS export ABC transporter permease LptF [Lichenifustis flavocetrariae]MCW6508069.1 LPS export ABC transporter permease LptF [Lichenifustis flavocetrariae]